MAKQHDKNLFKFVIIKNVEYLLSD